MLHKIKFLALMLVVATTSVFAQEDSEKDDDFDLVHKKNCPHPYVVSVVPEAGSMLDLSQDTVYFRVTFSEDMGEARGIQWHGKKADYYWNLDAKDVPMALFPPADAKIGTVDDAAARRHDHRHAPAI